MYRKLEMNNRNKDKWKNQYIIIWNALVTIMYKKLREKILGEEIISLPHTAVIKWIETEVETSWKCSLNDKFDQFIDISIKETFESSLGFAGACWHKVLWFTTC